MLYIYNNEIHVCFHISGHIRVSLLVFIYFLNIIVFFLFTAVDKLMAESNSSHEIVLHFNRPQTLFADLPSPLINTTWLSWTEQQQMAGCLLKTPKICHFICYNQTLDVTDCPVLNNTTTNFNCPCSDNSTSPTSQITRLNNTVDEAVCDCLNETRCGGTFTSSLVNDSL